MGMNSIDNFSNIPEKKFEYSEIYSYKIIVL